LQRGGYPVCTGTIGGVVGAGAIVVVEDGLFGAVVVVVGGGAVVVVVGGGAVVVVVGGGAVVVVVVGAAVVVVVGAAVVVVVGAAVVVVVGAAVVVVVGGVSPTTQSIFALSVLVGSFAIVIR
jgi:hypothetical protein